MTINPAYGLLGSLSMAPLPTQAGQATVPGGSFQMGRPPGRDSSGWSAAAPGTRTGPTCAVRTAMSTPRGRRLGIRRHGFPVPVGPGSVRSNDRRFHRPKSETPTAVRHVQTVAKGGICNPRAPCAPLSNFALDMVLNQRPGPGAGPRTASGPRGERNCGRWAGYGCRGLHRSHPSAPTGYT